MGLYGTSITYLPYLHQNIYKQITFLTLSWSWANKYVNVGHKYTSQLQVGMIKTCLQLRAYYRDGDILATL